MTSLGTLQNGGVVTTQFVIPCNLSIIQQQHLPPQAQTTTFLQKFIKGEPLALGVAQIMIGIMQMLLGGLLWADIFQSGHWTIYSGVTFWGAVLFITSASLSIAAQKKGAPCLVKGSLGMNIISSISAGIGIIIYSFDLAYLIYFYPYNGCHNDDDYNPECTVLSEAYYHFRNGTLVLCILLSLLELCISISTSVFGCKSLYWRSSRSQTEQPLFYVQDAFSQDLRVSTLQQTGITMGQEMAMSNGLPVAQGVPMPQERSADGEVAYAYEYTTVEPKSVYENPMSNGLPVPKGMSMPKEESAVEEFARAHEYAAVMPQALYEMPIEI